MGSNGFSASIFLQDETATSAWGSRIAPYLKPGDVLLLTGEIGAGKTHLARAIIQSRLDTSEDVPSPTFTLVQTYQTDLCEIWHADLYRLSDSQEIEELGLVDAYETAIVLIEWPDRLGDVPQNALHISIGEDNDGRRLVLYSEAKCWNRLEQLFDA